MRTSRVAKDTARLVNALSPRKTRPKNYNIRNTANGLDEAPSSGDAKPHATNRTSTRSTSTSTDTPAATYTRKRKRATITSGSPVSGEITEEISATTAKLPRRAVALGVTRPKKAKRQPAKKIVAASGEVEVQPPPNWEEVFDLTREMRKQWLAPVDTMGCESLAEDHRSPRDRRFQTLVALMLSSQTKDTVTSVAMKNLQDGLPGGFTLESILAVDPATLNGLISKVGFHNNKTKYIKAAAQVLREQYDSDIPDTIEGLISLPGVGPKMAYLCMSAAWGRDEGIGVDVHVHRITNLWGWHKTKEPEETRAALESWLPRDKWHEINHLLVGFGQTYCPPVGKRCEECKLAARGLCPSAVVGKDFKIQNVKQELIVENGDGQSATVKEEHKTEVRLGVVKAEDLSGDSSPQLEANIPDIEDIGRSTRKRRR